MKKAAIVYHFVDYDGIVSCSVSRSYLISTGQYDLIELIGYNYGLPIPLGLENYDEIYMVDISFPPEVMKALPKEKVTWIDHHITAINNSKVHGYDDLPGIRVDGKAACRLCFEYFFPGIELPRIVKACASYDVWDKNNEFGLDWKDEIIPIQDGLRVEVGMKINDFLEAFHDLCYNEEYYETILKSGKLIQKYQAQKSKSDMKNFGFPVTVAGKYRGFCVVSTIGGSLQFESVLNDYDIYVVAQRRNNPDGSTKYQVSLYAEPGRVDLNLGEYAQSLGPGNGGHACASGLTLSESAFYELLSERKI